MRVIEYSRYEGKDSGIKDDFIYCLTIDEDRGIENYGIGIYSTEDGKKEIVPGITYFRKEIESLASLLSKHAVTPITLRDVLEDML